MRATLLAALATAASAWQGTMKTTHYWDCSGQGCDATTLQPWNENVYVSSPGYAPQDPNCHGGPSSHGEKIWATGAASDTLANLMGADDGCCGSDTQSTACGKCVLIQNPDAVNADWKVIVMKKNRCPPWSNGCGAGTPHFDIAAPGFDNLQFSTANVCGVRGGTGFSNQQQSATLGSWYQSHADTSQAAGMCDQLPAAFQPGCKLFASWGWKKGDPSAVKYQVVECPAAFVAHIGQQFGPSGPTPTTASCGPPPPPTPAPPATAAPPPTPEPACATTVGDSADCRSNADCCAGGKTCYEKNQYWAGCKDSCSTSWVDPYDGERWSCTVLGTNTGGSAPSPTTAPPSTAAPVNAPVTPGGPVTPPSPGTGAKKGHLTMWSTQSALIGSQCEFANAPVNSVTDAVLSPYLRSKFHCAIGDGSSLAFGAGELCGACYRIRSLNDAGTGGTPGHAGEAIVQVSNGGAGGPDHFDCILEGFEAITGAQTGIFDVEYEQVPCCDVTGGITAINWADKNAHYAKWMFENVGGMGTIDSAELCIGNSACKPFSQRMGNTFVFSGLDGTAGVPASFKLTQNGVTVTLANCYSTWPVDTGARCNTGVNFGTCGGVPPATQPPPPTPAPAPTTPAPAPTTPAPAPTTPAPAPTTPAPQTPPASCPALPSWTTGCGCGWANAGSCGNDDGSECNCYCCCTVGGHRATCGAGGPPVTAAPITEAPVTVSPTTRAPSTLSPTTQVPHVAPVTDSPTTLAPISEAPVTASPTTEAPATGSPTTEAPVTASPTTEAPASGSPTTEAPVTASPTTGAPATGSPTTEAPVTPSPTSVAPVTAAPITGPPATVSPTTHAPRTLSPTTQVPHVAPVTNSPTTLAPISEAPVTASPTTGAPATASPTTGAPVTPSPTSVAPVTATPTMAPTRYPTTAPTTPDTPPPTTAAPKGGSGCSTGLWGDCTQTQCCQGASVCYSQSSDYAQCRAQGDCPSHWRCSTLPGPATPPPPPGCSVKEWGACTDTSSSCCESGLNCYRQSQHYAQCLKPDTCPAHWECTTTGQVYAAANYAAARDEGAATSVSPAAIAGLVGAIAAVGLAGLFAAKTFKGRGSGDGKGDDDEAPQTPSPSGGAGMSMGKGQFEKVDELGEVGRGQSGKGLGVTTDI